MRLIRQDLRNGLIKLSVDTPDDLWHLEKVLEEGDRVTARTVRKSKIKRGSEIGEGDRRPVRLKIALEKKDFRRETHSLRLTGRIIEGPDDMGRGYHSLDVDSGTVLSIEKEWKKVQVDRLKSARTRRPPVLVCVLDREEAEFFVIRDSGIESRGSVRRHKTRDGDGGEPYHSEVYSGLKGEKGPVVLAGPGFERENVLKFIEKRDRDLATRIILEHAFSTGTAGIQEVLKKAGARALKEGRMSREAELVERLMEGISKDSAVVYGKGETARAAEMGAVEELLLSDELMLEEEGLADLVEKQGGRVTVISAEHEAGERFLGLGGVAGFLRYRLSA